MKKPIVYIAGPITGMPNLNNEAFAEAAATLRAKGYEAINPQELHEGATDHTWEGYMCRDIPHLCKADIVAKLHGWEASNGAFLEVTLANQLKKLTIGYDILKAVTPESAWQLVYNNKMAPACNP